MFANNLTDMNYTSRLFATIILTTIFISAYTTCDAQEDQSFGNWNAILIKGKISPQWSLYGEGHIRSSNYDLKYDYFEIKSSIGYRVTQNFMVLVGTGFFNTDEPGGFFRTPARQKEFRTWLELNLKQTFTRFYFEHRCRLEQRFLTNNYKNRFKYRLGLLLPVNKAELIGGSIYLAVNDEFFIPQYGVTVVEKNRLYLGMGYKMNPTASFQIGCVNDTDYKLSGHVVINYLQLMLIYDFTNLLKKHI